jgi:hypothetical protein
MLVSYIAPDLITKILIEVSVQVVVQPVARFGLWERALNSGSVDLQGYFVFRAARREETNPETRKSNHLNILAQSRPQSPCAEPAKHFASI